VRRCAFLHSECRSPDAEMTAHLYHEEAPRGLSSVRHELALKA
jgi:hypothetical protein